MSVVNFINDGQTVNMFTDGGLYQDDGTVESLSTKVQICPHINAAFSFRSSLGWWSELFNLVRHRFNSFDHMVNGISPLFLGLVEKQARLKGVQFVYDELWFCGWSESREQTEVYGIGCNGFSHDIHGGTAPACELVRIDSPRIAIPTKGVENSVFFDTTAKDIDALGINLMEAQRSVPWDNNEHKDVHIVAGFVQKTALTRDGITTKIIKTWNDKPGFRICGTTGLKTESASVDDLSGLVPAPAVGDGAAGKFLKADGTWAATPGLRYDAPQSLSSGDQQQAQENIGASATGSAVLTAVDAATGRVALNAAPLPAVASGVGQFAAHNRSSGAAFVLPSGGTWAYVYTVVNVSTSVWGGGFRAGIGAGGATIEAGQAGFIYYGYVWRVA